MTLKYNSEMLAAFIEWTKGIFTEKGCGGTNVISREIGSFPPSTILSKHEYVTQSYARGTTPKIVSFDSKTTLYRGIFKTFPFDV